MLDANHPHLVQIESDNIKAQGLVITRREPKEQELRTVWERMNPSGDILHAGPFRR